MLMYNPVVISVSVMIVLCLFNLNIVLALLIAAMSAGLAAGMSIPNTMGVLISGMGGNSETALAYFLLGAFAVAINKTGLASWVCRKLENVVGKRKVLLMFVIVGIACLSGTVIPVHIAFIPILIPPQNFLNATTPSTMPSAARRCGVKESPSVRRNTKRLMSNG